MGHCLFSNDNYKIIKCRGNFLLINTEKDFKHGHTHVYNYDIGKIIIYACIHGEFPKRLTNLYKNERVLISVIRICSNKYKRKFQDLLFNLQNKKEDT